MKVEPVYVLADASHHFATHAGNFRRKLKCSKCGAPPGTFCVNLTTGWPVKKEHTARVRGKA